MQIKWDELAQVALVSLAFAVGIAVVFTLGVLGTARGEGGRNRVVTLAGSGIAFALCALAAGYGLYLLIPQFH